MNSYTKIRSGSFLAAIIFWMLACGNALAQTDKPNILVIWGDDVGMYNISA